MAAYQKTDFKFHEESLHQRIIKVIRQHSSSKLNSTFYSNEQIQL
jgi:hypothetical protein